MLRTYGLFVFKVMKSDEYKYKEDENNSYDAGAKGSCGCEDS